MGKQAQSIDSAILKRARSLGPGAVFTAADFLTLGSRGAVDQALSRNARRGTLRKIARGLYDVPITDRRIGVLSPSPDVVARAIAGRDAARLQPTGAYAANLLGLTTQVPTRVVYLTDGGNRSVRVGRVQVVLRRTTPRQMATAGTTSGTVIQALRWLGKKHVDDSTVNLLRRKLSTKDKRELLRNLRNAPVWVAEVIRKVASKTES